MGNTLLPMASGIAEFVMRTAIALLLPLVIQETGIYIAEASVGNQLKGDGEVKEAEESS